MTYGKETDMPPLASFDPPGNLTDLNATGRQLWNDYISQTTDTCMQGNAAHTNDSPRAQYYNLTHTDNDADAVYQDVS